MGFVLGFRCLRNSWWVLGFSWLFSHIMVLCYGVCFQFQSFCLLSDFGGGIPNSCWVLGVSLFFTRIMSVVFRVFYFFFHLFFFPVFVRVCELVWPLVSVLVCGCGYRCVEAGFVQGFIGL